MGSTGGLEIGIGYREESIGGPGSQWFADRDRVVQSIGRIHKV